MSLSGEQLTAFAAQLAADPSHWATLAAQTGEERA
jgi:hypothetical protein